MAIMNEPNGYTGTIHGVTVYKMYGKRYMRTKSSLSRKRVLTGKSFEKTRQCAAKMGHAAKIGSEIYKALPADIKDRWLYRAITGEAVSLLYEGKTVEEVKTFLWKKYITETGVEEKVVLSPTGNNAAPSTRHNNRRLWQLFRERWEKQKRGSSRFKQAWQNSGYFNPRRFREVLVALSRIPEVRNPKPEEYVAD